MRLVVLFAPLFLVLGLLVEAQEPDLPYSTVFKGEPQFDRLVQKAESDNWRSLPLGERTVAVGKALLGTPYASYTLEIDNHTESPSVNLNGVDCWTYFEIALGFARMLEIKTRQLHASRLPGDDRARPLSERPV